MELRLKIFILLNIIFVAHCESNLAGTYLRDFSGYMDNVIQTFIYDLEDAGLCTIRMNDFIQPINQSLYGFEVLGELNYMDGFVLSLGKAFLKVGSTRHQISNINRTATVETILMLENMRFAYDVVGNLTTGIHKATGIYNVKTTEWRVKIINDLSTDVKVVQMDWMSTLPDNTGRINFLPNNDYTAVFARENSLHQSMTCVSPVDVKFRLGTQAVGDSIRDWRVYMIPLIQRVADRLLFPEIVYESYL